MSEEVARQRSPTAGEAPDRKGGTAVLPGGRNSVPKRMNCGLQEQSSSCQAKAVMSGPGSWPAGEASSGVEGIPN